MGSQKKPSISKNLQKIYDPPLTVEIDGAKELESMLDLENCSSELCSILDLPDCSHDFQDSFDSFEEETSFFRGFEPQYKNSQNEDKISHYTATTMSTFDDTGMITSDFENSSTSPVSQQERRLSNSSPPQLQEIDSKLMPDYQNNIMPVAIWSSDALEARAQEIEKAWQIKRHSKATQKNGHIKKPSHKDRFNAAKVAGNISGLLDNVVEASGMNFSYLFNCEETLPRGVLTSETALKSDSLPLYSDHPGKRRQEIQEQVSKKRSFEESPRKIYKVTTGRPRKEKRIKCLKRDSSVTLEKKVDFFKVIVENARRDNVQGIILRDQAAAELRLGKDEHRSLNLTLLNFDLVCQYLSTRTQGQKDSFRTIWRISRTQINHHVSLEFHLSDETASVPDNDMEISVFTLIAPGHTTKHLVTSCQYLEMVNFILGKDYNYLINDNLAETTVGSDGKMISTQKHHASRVRSHVKKLLKRHVVKDFKRYTAEDRSDPVEFEYRMALHNLVLQCYVKKPFESKVSIALMELGCVKNALTKQAEFFTFKKI